MFKQKRYKCSSRFIYNIVIEKSFLLFFVIITILSVRCNKSKHNEITIGAILCLTGSGSVYGQDAKRGIEIAQDSINQIGGIKNKPLRIVFQDDQTDPRVAVSAFNTIRAAENVEVIIGAVTSSSTLAIAPLANEEKVILFSPGASSPKITNAGDYIFRNWISDVYEAGKIADYAFNVLRIRRMAILWINNEYGVGLKEVFAKQFVKYGGTLVGLESYEQGTTNFQMQITKLKNINIDAVYLPGYYRELALILNQSRKLAFKTQFLSCVSFEDPKLLEIAGINAENVIYATPMYDPKSLEPNVVSFYKKFIRQYNREPGIFAGHAYDAVFILKKVIEEGSYRAEDIKDRLYALKNFQGVTGVCSFDRNGDIIKPVTIKTVKNGKFVVVQ